MFGKKILSIVGLLLISSRLASAADVPVCTATYTVGSSCTLANCDGENVNNLLLVTGSDTKEYIVKIDDGKTTCTEVNEITGCAAAYYYDALNSAEVCTVKKCAESDDDKLLLATGIKSETGKNYVVKVKSSGGACELLKEPNTGYLNGEDVCVSADGVITLKGKEPFCNHECDSYKKCKSTGECIDVVYKSVKRGGCDPSADYDAENNNSCQPGYYVMNKEESDPSASFVDAGVEGNKLFKCVADRNRDVTVTCEAKDPNLNGYYLNANENDKDDYPFIECKKGKCVAIAKPGATCSKKGDFIAVEGDGKVEYKICVTGITDSAIPVIEIADDGTVTPKSSGAKYFVEHDSSITSNVFQEKDTATTTNAMGEPVRSSAVDGYYFMIEISKYSVALVARNEETGGKDNKYRYAKDTQKIYEKGDEAVFGDICLKTTPMIEYVKDFTANDDIDYYVQEFDAANAKGPLDSYSPPSK